MEAPRDREWAAELARREEAGLLRRLDEHTAPVGADFSSNDYLSLARHPEVIAGATRALEQFGAGGRASRLLGGGCELHERAEREAAEWLGTEAALLFPSGFQANLGLVTALARPGDAVLSDEHNHASVVDACRLSRARTLVYRHRDLEHLEHLLSDASSARRRIVVTESLFSMSGDLAPLAELAELCRRFDADLLVDEAHAVGVLGAEGAGALADLDAPACLAGRTVTGGKALGAGGAFVAGSRRLREILVNTARSFIYTTSPAPAIAGALAAAIPLCREMDEQRAGILSAAGGLAESLGLSRPDGAIVLAPLATPEAAISTERDLRAAGLEVRAVRPPTLPESGLRLVVHAHNTPAEIEQLAERLQPRLEDRGPAPDLARTAEVVFVAGTDTGVGKTVVAALLARASGGLYWKPVQTGDELDAAEVARLAGLGEGDVLPSCYELELPASPHEAAAHAGTAIDPARIRNSLARIKSESAPRPVVAELAGGLHVPLTDSWRQSDWLAEERPPVVLVARSGLGTLNHTLLSLEALRARSLVPRALFLVGEPHTSNRDTLAREAGVDLLFEVPRFEPLNTDALDAWLSANDLEPLWT